MITQKAHFLFVYMKWISYSVSSFSLLSYIVVGGIYACLSFMLMAKLEETTLKSLLRNSAQFNHGYSVCRQANGSLKGNGHVSGNRWIAN